jgi:photosystem II stability/assembly factor-like uncharacterized protein
MGISAHDGALDPTDSSMIIGTTKNGLILSVGSGKAFTAISSAPLIALLSWDQTRSVGVGSTRSVGVGSTRLVGVGPSGVVYESTDMGMTWRKLATVPGQPGALSVGGNEIAILAGMTVYYSSDSGATFKERIVGVPGH